MGMHSLQIPTLLMIICGMPFRKQDDNEAVPLAVTWSLSIRVYAEEHVTGLSMMPGAPEDADM